MGKKFDRFQKELTRRAASHFTHRLKSVYYGVNASQGEYYEGFNVSIECLDCHEVLWDNGK